jgi:protocatechuate 3,4-dioxygenase beta subunit
MTQKKFDRRNFLKLSSLGLGGAALSNPITEALAATCGLTPAQTAGPFYPGEAKFTETSDLTQIPGKPRAQGKVIYIRGKVVDSTHCLPLANVNVEIWQACESGSYNHPSDPNAAVRDPNFKYWGEAFTDQDGSYIFKTIIPGAYPANSTWNRPPHIHFRVMARGYEELVTQSYFKGHPLNDQDLILQRMPASDREKVIVDFKNSPEGFEAGTVMGEFDIVIKPIV